MSELLKRIKNIFTVVRKQEIFYYRFKIFLESELDDFNFTTEFFSGPIARVINGEGEFMSFLHVLFRSIFGYTGADRKPASFTSAYAYFKRDSRRSFPATVAVTQRSVNGLLPVPDRIAAMETEKIEEPAVPGKKRVYKKSNEQPPADGYFPIINCD